MLIAMDKGFTLAELLVAIAVGAILLSVAVPSYSLFLQNSRQAASANELLSSLHFARDLAISRNQRVVMCRSATGAGCQPGAWSDGWIVFVDGNNDRAVSAGEPIEQALASVDAPSVDTGDFGAYLVYRPNGRVMVDDVRDNTGQFTLCDERGAAHARVVGIDISGRPRVSDRNLDGSVPVCP